LKGIGILRRRGWIFGSLATTVAVNSGNQLIECSVAAAPDDPSLATLHD
jgi:hypothetical protein